MRWCTPPVNDAQAAGFSRKLGISLTAAILLQRLGIQTETEAEEFLDPRLKRVEDPFRITHLDRAVARLRMAMERAERIMVFGDYDVDGVTSTAFLVSVLQTFGVVPRFIVPLRLEEGYGLSRSALDRALESNLPNLLIAVDCGTNSVDEVAYLRSRGIDVIILDHHLSKDRLPQDCILVNPHIHDPANQPWSDLCTVGLVFKFMHGLLKQLRAEGDELAEQVNLKDYLDFAALGTIADLVPLRGENRILAKIGLAHLRESHRPGLNALFEVSGIELGSEITPYDIAFRLGPRINACGRLADAAVPVDLLLCSDWQRCLTSARQLDGYNKDRQEIERRIFEQAEALVEDRFRDAAGLVLHQPDWHPGVVGIVASRLSQKYHRPTLVLGAENGLAKGSGRSVAGINLVDVLMRCTHLLDHWGGHPMAVGVSALPEHLPALQEAFAESVLLAVQGNLPEPNLEIAAWVRPTELGGRLLEELDRFAPFGQGNPEPVFGLRGYTFAQSPALFGQGHLRFQISQEAGLSIGAVAWKMADRIPPTGQPLDLAVRLGWNVWNGRRSPRLTLVDWRPTQRA